MSGWPITVLKLGGSVLTDDESLRLAVGEIYRHLRVGERVVAVVSAQAGATDKLVARAAPLAQRPEPAAYAAFLATAESRSAAALALAADAAGIPTTLLDATQLGIEAAGDRLDAEPVRLRSPCLRNALERRPLAVVPGFVGLDRNGSPCLLGRGGSDLTAVFLAAQLGAERCVLVKDIDGWFSRDPRLHPDSPRYRTLRWEDAVSGHAPIVQRRAVRTAARLGTPFEVRGWGSAGGTRVGPEATATESAPAPEPLDVVVLGCGSVGAGVVRHLRDRPKEYCLRAILVRDSEREREPFVPRPLLTSDAGRALAEPADVVIELLGGLDPARDLVAAAFERGAAVVTANKELAIDHWRPAATDGRRRAGRLLESATVGGAAPMLEAVRRAARSAGVAELRGIVNGTSNYLLGELARGSTFADALDAARRLGMAEAAPSADLSGLDAARKLVLLARAAGAPLRSVDEVRVEALDPGALPAGSRAPVKQVARLRCRRRGGSPAASVTLDELSPDDPLADVGEEWNALEIEDYTGRTTVVRGRGAERWPTALAVLADVETVRRGRRVPGGALRTPAAEEVGR